MPRHSHGPTNRAPDPARAARGQSRGGRAAACLCAIAVASACGRGAAGPLAPRQSLIALEDGPQPAASLERGRYVAVDEVARPTLTAVRVVRVTPRCATTADLAPGPCVAPVPDELRGAPELLVEMTPAPSGRQLPRPRRLVVPAPRDGVLALPAGLRPRDLRRVELRALPPLESRDVVTRPLAIPPGARLRFAVAIEEAAQSAATAPVVLTLAALDGADEVPLFRLALDPTDEAADRRWREEDVSLDAVAGRTVRLRFAARRAEAWDVRPALPVWADPVLWAPAPPDPRPSIVLVSLDTLRARSTSTYGYRLPTSPYLTELAGEGALFLDAFTTFSNTLGSHMSMLTGLYPATHGVVALDRKLAPERATLAETLRRAGWNTAAFTEDGLLEGSRGFQRGFGLYAENTGVFPAAGDAPGTFARALAWARRNATSPFFLFVHTYAVHLPYVPPRAYAHLFEEGVPADARAPVAREQLRYEQEIRALDDDVATLVHGLERIVPGGRLLLVVTADHGEEFGEHGQVTHLQLFDEVMHVPLLVRWPGHVTPGTRIATPVSLVDVVPTLLALAGTAAPPVDGLDLGPLLRAPGAGLARTTVLAQSLPSDLTGKQWRFVARDADAKCILPEEGPGDCYDLAADPGEKVPHPPRAGSAEAALHAAAAAYRTRARVTIGAAGAQSIAAGARDADAATRRKLEALGYAQ